MKFTSSLLHRHRFVRFASLILALLMLCAIFSSCQGEDITDESTEDTSNEQSESVSATAKKKKATEKATLKKQDIELTEENTVTARVMSFNIRVDEFTPERIDLVIKMIETYKPDSIGFQEATEEWMEVLVDRIGEEYDYVGCGRNSDKKGEANPVFYLKSRFTLIESDTKWLSDSPTVAGSKVSGSAHPRIFTYALLEETESGKQFAHINTHLDHTSENARLRQADILIKHIQEFDSKSISFVLTGDFNDKSTSQAYTKIISYGLLNCTSLAKKSETGDTYHNYGQTGKIIDFIFVNASTAEVEYYRACTETFTDEEGNVAYPSDHNPIIADIKILGKAQ